MDSKRSDVGLTVRCRTKGLDHFGFVRDDCRRTVIYFEKGIINESVILGLLGKYLWNLISRVRVYVTDDENVDQSFWSVFGFVITSNSISNCLKRVFHLYRK